MSSTAAFGVTPNYVASKGPAFKVSLGHFVAGAKREKLRLCAHVSNSIRR